MKMAISLLATGAGRLEIKNTVEPCMTDGGSVAVKLAVTRMRRMTWNIIFGSRCSRSRLGNVGLLYPMTSQATFALRAPKN